jgi:snRNA-activating protein complex subunit 3
MEAVHQSKKRPWICQEKIHIGTFIQGCDAEGLSAEVKKPTYSFESIAKQVVVETKRPEKEWTLEVSNDCDISQLNCPGEEDLLDNAVINLSLLNDVPLESVKLLKSKARKTKKKQKGVPQESNAINELMRINVSKQKFRRTNESKETLAVLAVELYRPMTMKPLEFMSYYCRRIEALPFELEIEVLSCQSLSDMRRFMSCASDFATLLDSQEPSPPSMFNAAYSSDMFKSGFFFINDTFYNDLETPDRIDYSQVIRDWASTRGQGIGPFETRVMHETTFKDLTIQLGYPYLYVHQGNCEHIFVFKDLRILDRSKNSEKEFPKVVRTIRRTRIKCFLCKCNTANVIVENDPSLPSAQTLFCHDCKDIYYRHSGQPKGLRVQSYVDSTALL